MLVNQSEALTFLESIADAHLRDLLLFAATQVLLNLDSLEDDFDMLFFYKVLADLFSQPNIRIELIKGNDDTIFGYQGRAGPDIDELRPGWRAMILRCHESYDTLGDYDPATRAFVVFSRTQEPDRASSERMRGFFGDLGGNRILFYRLAGALYVEIDGRRVPMEGHTIEFQRAGCQRHLRMLSGVNVIFDLTYDQEPLDPPLSEDPTPFVEEEHFDFGLLLANVSRDRERQDRMFGAMIE